MRLFLQVVKWSFVGMAAFFVLVFAIGLVSKQQRDAERAERARVLATMTPEQRATAEREAAARAAAAKQAELERSAQAVCRQFVRQSLHDPDGAQFEDSRTFHVEKRKDGTYLVQVRLRARNAFNALRAAVFDCVTRPPKTGDDWRLVKLRQLDL